MNAAGERAVLRLHLRIAEFALVAGLHFTAQMVRHKLHAVADAEHRYAQVEQSRVGLVFAVVHGIWAAGKDDAFGVEGLDVGQRHVVGVQLAIHMGFAHAAGDELGDLRTEVEDEDFVLDGHVKFLWRMVNKFEDVAEMATGRDGENSVDSNTA